MRVRSVMAATTVAAGLSACAFLFSAAPASASLTTLLSPLPTLSSVTNLLSSPTPLPSLPIVNDLLTPLPTVTGVPPLPIPGALNDTINQLTGTVGVTDPVGGTGGGGGTGNTRGTGPTNTSTSTTTGGSNSGSKTGTSNVPTAVTSVGGTGVLTDGGSFTPYGSITGNAAKRAAERALHLMGPLAPPVLLGCFALAVLMMLSRGSTKLVKLDPTGIARRSWRI